MSGFGQWLKKNWWWFALPVVVVVVTVGVFFCGRLGLCGKCSDADLKCVLAEYHQVDESNLFVNIPPEFSRYPGTILLAPENIRLATTDSAAPGLGRGASYEFDGTFRSATTASGSSTNNILEAVTSSKTVAGVEITINPGRTVDADMEFLRDKLEGSTFVDRLKQKNLASVIYKAYEGEVTISARFADTLSLAGYQKEQERLKKLAGSSRLEFGTGSEKVVSWRFNDVYAFTAVDVSSLLDRFLDFVGAPAGPMDTTQVIRSLLSFDPAEIPDLNGTLEEIGPGAGKGLMDVIVQGDSLTRTRGSQVLKDLPKSARPTLIDPGVSIKDPDPSVRAWSVLQLADSPSRPSRDLLAGALTDETPAVRLLASQSIAQQGTADARTAAALKEATRDEAPDVRIAASQALAVVTTPPTRAVARADSAMSSGNPQTQQAYLGLVASIHETNPDQAVELLRRGLRSTDSSVRLEALQQAGQVEGASDSLKRELEMLSRDPDPRVRQKAGALTRRNAIRTIH